MRKLVLLISLLPYLSSLGQGYKVYMSDGKVDAYAGETAVSVSMNDDSLHYDGHEYVDLGLPSCTLWATTNAGAGKGNPGGLHFALETAKTDGLWGGDWRIPGNAEFQELLRVCQWEWTKEGVCQGYRVTGPNGNSMFLPSAGYINPDGSFAGGLTGQVAGYWTNEGYSFGFSPIAKGLSTVGNALQLSLRPVIGGNQLPDGRSEVMKDGEHEYVDLGLSVLWATTNIGAEKPEDYGYYFCPGSTEPMPSGLDANNYDEWIGSHSPFYINGVGIGGYIINGVGIDGYIYQYYYLEDRQEECEEYEQQSVLFSRVSGWNEMGYWIRPEHDAATVLWGDGWRMPTLSEFKELIENTTTRSNFTRVGRNGNAITLPRTGRYNYGSFNSSDYYYLTSSIVDGGLLSVDLSSRNINYYYDRTQYLYPIRPVKDKPKAGLTDKTTTAQQEMVDLGLSVLWANCNWGATSPKDKGEYVAWGETFPKAEYNRDYHFYGEYFLKQQETMFGKKGWTLPSTENVQELLQRCTWTREADGYRVTGPNGKSIFLPYTGFRDGAVLNYPDEVGLYWTSDNGQALRMENDGNYEIIETNVCAGMAVRPVMSPVCPETGDAVGVDWHSASVTCKARGNYSDFGIQLCFVDKMDNQSSGAWRVPSSPTSLKNGKYTASLLLQPNTTYYYRAYAVTNDSIPQTLYGDIKQLKTTANVPAIDLGLSVKWAPVNLGATSESDTLYYCYLLPENPQEQLPTIFSGYNSYLAYLAPQKASWGEGWRIPTDAEFQELMERCRWEWTGKGYKVTANNGNRIFLPENSSYYPYAPGHYWTQTPSERYAGCYNIFKFTDTDRKITFGPAINQCSIRPVKK